MWPRPIVQARASWVAAAAEVAALDEQGVACAAGVVADVVGSGNAGGPLKPSWPENVLAALGPYA